MAVFKKNGMASHRYSVRITLNKLSGKDLPFLSVLRKAHVVCSLVLAIKIKNPAYILKHSIVAKPIF